METVTVPMQSLAEVVRLQLDNGGRANLTVTGNSMYPMLISHRDTVTLIPPVKLSKGDVILFQRASGAYILHRIVGFSTEGFVCCGDNQIVRESVSREQVVAVVDGFVRKGKPYPVDAGFYRAYAAVWMRLFVLRRVLYIGRRKLGSLRRKIKNCLTKK